MSQFPNAHVSAHPLVAAALARLRAVDTPVPAFRQAVQQVATLLLAEATADLPLVATTVTTPLAVAPAARLATPVALFPVLRAGLGMVPAALALLDEAPVWHLGLYRDHKTLEPVAYYNRLPSEPEIDLCLILDPMLATGGSAVASVDVLKQWGAARIKFLGLIAAPEGVERLATAHPDVPIHLAALDERLNAQAYIVPGLGDAGDRQFGTG